MPGPYASTASGLGCEMLSFWMLIVNEMDGVVAEEKLGTLAAWPLFHCLVNRSKDIDLVHSVAMSA